MELEQILSSLSGDAYKKAVIALVDRVEVPESHLVRLLGVLYFCEDFSTAEDLAFKVGKPKILIDLHEKNQRWNEAARVAERAEMPDIAREFYLKAIQSYEQQEWFSQAASIARRIGDEKRAGALYASAVKKEEESGTILRALDHAEEAGLSDDVRRLVPLCIEACERDSRLHFLRIAFDLAQKYDLPEKARQLYPQAAKRCIQLRDYYRAARIYREFEPETERAEELFLHTVKSSEEEGGFAFAARVAREAGFTEKADVLDALVQLISPST